MLNKALFSSNSVEWATPQLLFNQLNEEFHFTLDPCATDYNHKCSKYYTKEINGLNQSWYGEVVFCNPPYGKDLPLWVEKCYSEHRKYGITIVMLIPVRTDTIYFHKFIYHQAEIRFLKGRIRFSDSDQNAPFPSMLVIYK